MLDKCLEYFNGDSLAANVARTKYLLDNEESPDDKHHRLASEFARIESNYPFPMSEDIIYEYLKDYKYIIPQGSPMAGIGNPSNHSLSNCFVIESPNDSISGICDSAKTMSNVFKNRGGVGIDISTLRPKGAVVHNASEHSTGAYSFSDLYNSYTKIIGAEGRRAALMISLDIRHPDASYFTTMKEDLTKCTNANISLICIFPLGLNVNFTLSS